MWQRTQASDELQQDGMIQGVFPGENAEVQQWLSALQWLQINLTIVFKILLSIQAARYSFESGGWFDTSKESAQHSSDPTVCALEIQETQVSPDNEQARVRLPVHH